MSKTVQFKILYKIITWYLIYKWGEGFDNMSLVYFAH